MSDPRFWTGLLVAVLIAGTFYAGVFLVLWIVL